MQLFAPLQYQSFFHSGSQKEVDAARFRLVSVRAQSGLLLPASARTALS